MPCFGGSTLELPATSLAPEAPRTLPVPVFARFASFEPFAFFRAAPLAPDDQENGEALACRRPPTRTNQATSDLEAQRPGRQSVRSVSSTHRKNGRAKRRPETRIVTGVALEPRTPAEVARRFVLTAVAGASMARRQGFAVIAKLQGSMRTGQDMGLSAVEAALVLAAAVMMLLPGFVTDFFGIAMLIPPLRRPVARLLLTRARNRMPRQVVVMGGSFGPTSGRPGPYNADSHANSYDDDQDPPPPGVIDV